MMLPTVNGQQNNGVVEQHIADGIESISSSNADAAALHCGRDIYRQFRKAGKSGSRSCYNST